MPGKISHERYASESIKNGLPLSIKGQNVLLSEKDTTEIIDFLNENILFSDRINELIVDGDTKEGDLLFEYATDSTEKGALDGGELSLLVQKEIEELTTKLDALMKLQSVLPKIIDNEKQSCDEALMRKLSHKNY